MIKTLKLTVIGVLISTLAFAQYTDRKDVKVPGQGKAPKKEMALKGANDFQKTFTKKQQKASAAKAVTIFSEDFSSGSIPSTFTLYNQDGLTPASNVSYVTDAWVANPNLQDSTDYTALSTSWYSPAGAADDWMVTPKITIPSGAFLSWNAIAYDPSYPDGYEVLISTTDSAIASFTTTLFSVSAENSAWTPRNVSLSAYAGQDVFIAFRNNSNDMFLLAIDDILVYQPDPYEIGVTAITEPNNNSGCAQTATENVTIDIENFGADSITNGFDVYYSINGSTPVSETISDTLLPGATMSYTFSTVADLSAYQNYDIVAYTSYPQDNVQSNDTASTSVVSADAQLTVKIHTDNYPSEISWELLDETNQVIATSPVFDTGDSIYTTDVCILSAGCYTLNIMDSYGDGILPPGGYEVYYNSTLVDSSYSFTGALASVYHIGSGCAANDMSVEMMYALGKFPKDGGSPQEVTAIVKNWGTNDLTNAKVFLDITGANTYQDTVNIATLNSLDTDTVTFTGFNATALGVNNVNVSVATDDNNSNNSMDYRQEVTDYTFNHADTAAIDQGIGFNDAAGMMVAKYHVNGTKSVRAARVNVSGSAAGNQLYGVLLDANGNILSTGAPVTIAAADTNTYVYLPINPFNVTDQDIYVGFAQIANPTAGYFPCNVQIEDPARSDVFYYVSGLNGGALTMNNTLGRWMIEGVIMNGVAVDAYMTGITEISTSCNMTDANVEIGIYNNGLDSIMGIDASYVVNNASPVTETINDTILPGDTLMYTFNTPIDASAFNLYEVEAYVTLAIDTINDNDTANTFFYNVEPADIPYSTGFEATDDYYAWTMIDGNDDGVVPTVLNAGTAAHSGTMIAYVPGGSVKQDEYVVSRCLNLEAGKTYEVSFWHRVGSFWGMAIPEDVQLVIGTSPDPASMTTMIADMGTIDVVAFTNASYNFQVSSNDVYYIAFHVTTDSPYYYLIDEFSVTDVTSVEETAENLAKVYPNPTNNILNVDGGELNIEQVQVYNTMGQLMHSEDVHASNVQLDVADYKAGMYFIRMMTDRGMITKKFQVNN